MPSWYLAGNERSRGPALASAAVTFSGAGDIVSGAAAWWGTRAYTAAAIGGNAIKLRRDSDNTTQTFVTVAGGGLDIASITTFKGAANLFVDTLYDQTGNGHDLVQATQALQPSFTLSGLGSLPIISFTVAAGHVMQSNSVTLAQAMTYSMVAKRTASFSAYNGVVTNQSNGVFFSVNPGNITLFAGSLPDAAAADNAFHAIQAVFNGASSVAYVDGSSSTVNAGANVLTGAQTWGTAGGSGLDGVILEAGAWASGFDATQQSNMNSNQHAYYGF